MKAALIGAAVTVAIGLCGWGLTRLLDYDVRLTRLEVEDSTDSRQDAELRELRATVRDLMLLGSLSERSLRPALPLRIEALPDVDEPSSVGGEVPIPAIDEAGEAAHGPLPEEYLDFRAEQADLEAILRARGLAPTEKPSRP